ncbi:MAG: extracellular solute-binding protein [Nitrospinota bacterium]
MLGRIFKFGLAGALAAAMVMSFPVPGSAGMREAKKEGSILWYSSLGLPIAQAVCNLYNSKKNGIKCILHRSGSGKLYRRYLLESKGGIYKADVIHTSNLGHFLNMRAKKILVKYVPKGIGNFNPKFKTDHGYWTILRASMLVPFYNTKNVKAADAPKSWKDIIDPKWQGKIVHSHPSYSGFVTNGMINIVKLHGWDYYKKMAALKPRIMQSALGGIPIVATGEADIGAGTVLYGLFAAIKKGEPVQVIIPTEGVPLVTSPNSVLAKAPHPNAAKAFTDFLFSKETQQLLANRFLHVGHPGVKYPKGLPALSDFKLMTISGKELKKENKPTRKMFRKLFGV